MRVVFVHPFTQRLSGPDESLLSLLPPLVARGVEPHLVVPQETPLADRYRALGVTLHEQRLTTLHRGMRATETALFGPHLLFRAAKLGNLLRRIRADIVHTNMETVLEGGLAAQMTGLPHVLHYRGNSLASPRRLFDVLTFLWTSMADRVFCISNATAEIFRVRSRADKVTVLFNPISVASFRSAVRSDDVRSSLGAGPGQPLVITMGRIHPRKDIDTFVRACARVAAVESEARFAIVGAAESPVELGYQAHVIDLIARLGLRDRLTFSGVRRDVASIMKAADVFVLSSRHEGFGRVVAEAMAAGTAVVATREGALPELINEPTHGLGAEPANDAEFSTQILALLGDVRRRTLMGLAAADRACDFDAERIAERVLGYYHQVLRSKLPS